MKSPASKPMLWLAGTVLLFAAVVLVYVIVLALQPEPGTTVEAAVQEMQRRSFHAAIDILTKVIRREPASTEALLVRGTCYAKTRQLTKARQDFDQALKLEPGLPAARLGLADILCREDDYDAALAAARDVAKAQPRLCAPYAVIGKAHYRLFERAARQCIALLEERPKEPLTTRAVTEIRQGRFGPAEQCLTHWKDKAPGDEKLAEFEAKLHEARTHFASTLDALKIGSGQTAERPGTGDPDTWLLLAAILLEQGEHQQALRTAERALALAGVDRVQATKIKAEVLSQRAARLVREGVKENNPQKLRRADQANREAIELLEKLVRTNPDAASVRDKLAMHYIRAGRFDDADLQALHNVKQSHSTMGHYVRGIVHLSKGEYEKAASEFLTVRGEMENEPRFHFSLGLAYYRRGGASARPALAATQFRRVILLMPNFVPARLRLAELYLYDGWYQEALEQCESVLAIPGRAARTDAQVYLLRSEAHRGLSQLDEARLWMRRAVEAAHSEGALIDQVRLMLELGMANEVLSEYELRRLKERDTPVYACIRGLALAKKGRPEEAIQNFEKAIRLDTQYVMAYVYLASVYESQGRLDKAVKEYQRGRKMLAGLAPAAREFNRYNRNLDDKVDKTEFKGDPQRFEKLDTNGDGIYTRDEIPIDPSLHFGIARLQILQGRFDLAKPQLKTVLNLDEKHVPARLRLATLALRERDYRSALQQATFVIRFCKETPEAHFLAGVIHSAVARRPAAEIRAAIQKRREKDSVMAGIKVTDQDIAAERRVAWDAAVRSYERAIEIAPGFRLSYEVALVYAMQEEFDKMASVYLRALRISPPAAKPQLQRQLAIAYLCSGDLDKAVKSAQGALDGSLLVTRPDPKEVLRNRIVLVNCLVGIGDFLRARAEVNRASGELPEFRRAYFWMINRLDALKRNAHLHQTPTVAAAMHRGVAKRLSLAFLFSRSGVVWLPYARELYQGLLRKDSENVVAMRLLGDLCIVLSRLRRAEGEAEKADALLKEAKSLNRQILDLMPDFALAHRNLAVIILEELRTKSGAAKDATPGKQSQLEDEVVKHFKDAIKAAPKSWLARLELAGVYQSTKRPQEAMRLYQEVIRLNPKQVQALNDYANLCVEENTNLKKALEYASKARQLDPLSGEVAHTLGVLHAALGQPDEAVEQFERARYLLPTHPTVKYHLALAYSKTGRKAKALALLTELIDSKARFDERAEAEALRDKLRQ